MPPTVLSLISLNRLLVTTMHVVLIDFIGDFFSNFEACDSKFEACDSELFEIVEKCFLVTGISW